MHPQRFFLFPFLQFSKVSEMANLSKASYQLFSRPEDERFNDFDSLYRHSAALKTESQVHWKPPGEVIPIAGR